MKFSGLVRQLKQTLSIFVDANGIVELRVPKSDSGPRSGLFDDLDLMAEQAATLDKSGAAGIYFTPNPILPSFTRPVRNRVARCSSMVCDADILRRRWLLLDFDPVRDAQCPSTDEEHDAAIARARSCRGVLKKLGWPEPILADSGNGAHLLYRVDIRIDESSDLLLRDCLGGLSLRFSTRKVQLDTGTGNASRLTRLYGTMNRKGEATDERPHRRSQLLEIPDCLEDVEVDLLKQFADLKQVPITQPKVRLDVGGWLADRNMRVAFDAPWNSHDHKWILHQCPWNERHTRSAFVVQFANGGVSAGCLHRSCRGKGWLQLKAIYQASHDAGDSDEDRNSNNLPKTTQAARLIEVARPVVELFNTPQGQAYASIRSGEGRRNYACDSAAFRDFLNHKHFQLTGTAPQPGAVQQAIQHFSAVARFDGPTEPVFLRVGSSGNRSFLDLANQSWEAVEISENHWRVVDCPPVRFRRVPGMLPLPTPLRGGDINRLRQFLNLQTDDNWLLYLSAQLAAIFPTGPYPILGIHGEAGSAKTTMARVFRKMVDPVHSLLRSMPKDIRDLMLMADNSWALCFDNLSFLPAWFSDCLCRISTGGGFSTRTLYTDDEEKIFDGQRPIVLNGIEELATRTDLLDRSVLLDLPVIKNFRPEREFWHKFEAAHPTLLGALLDVAVRVMRVLPRIVPDEETRMADFARIGAAVASVLEFPPGMFMQAYKRNRQCATAIAIEASPIAEHLCELAEEGWTGTATELLRRLDQQVDEPTRNRKSWPKTPRVLSGMMRRLSTALRTQDVEVDFGRDDSRNRNRTISIRRVGTSKTGSRSEKRGKRP